MNWWLFHGVTVGAFWFLLFCVYVVYGVQQYRVVDRFYPPVRVGPEAPELWMYMTMFFSSLLPVVPVLWIIGFTMWGFFKHVLPKVRLNIRRRIGL